MQDAENFMRQKKEKYLKNNRGSYEKKKKQYGN